MSRTLLDAVLHTENRYEVLTADTAREALELARRLCPDLILLDATLPPPEDGLSVCRRLKGETRTRRIPVVLVSPAVSSLDRVQVLEAGADDLLARPFNRLELLARVRSLLRIKSLNDQLDEVENVIYSLSRAVEAREGDNYEAHTERVMFYANALGREIGLNDDALRLLGQAVMLRDLGKIGLPDRILNKQGALSEEEKKSMQQHTILGEQIIAPLRSTAALVPIIRHHHERVDGKGYPDGLFGEQIPLGARIVAIADAYAAMLSHRPYRAALSPDKALAALHAGAGKQWDSRLVATFVAWTQRQPAVTHNLK
jgi:putative two-component system response regulator